MIEITECSVRDIWKHVFDGHVEEIVAATRNHRAEAKPRHQAQKSACNLSAVFAEPGLSSRIGHHYNLAIQYGDALKKLGYTLKVLHARKHHLNTPTNWLHWFHKPHQTPLNWHPWFYTPHHTLAYKPIQSATDLARVNDYFTAEFASALEQYKPDLWVIGTLRFTNALAAAKAITQSSHLPKRTILGVMEGDDPPDCADKRIVRTAFSQAAAAFNDNKIAHRLMVETDHVRDMLIECGFYPENIKRYQYVAAKRVTSVKARPDHSGRRAKIGYVGGTRPVRNPEVIAKLMCDKQTQSAADWEAQLDLNYIRRHCGDAMAQQLKQLDKAGSIRLHATGLKENEYFSLLASLDFVVMPYANRYLTIGSGVLIEAIYSKAIPILPRNSSMYDLYTSLGGLPPAFDEASVSSVTQAVYDALERWEELSQMAVEVYHNWCKHPESAEQWESDLKTWVTG